FLVRDNLPMNYDIKKIKLVATDADGVLTDGKIFYGENGRQCKNFSVKDGMAFKMLKAAGLKSIIISGKKTGILEKRVSDIDVDFVFENTEDKMKVLKHLCKRYKINMEEVCYMGDDILDIPVLESVGFSVAPRDACEDVKNIVKYVVSKNSGKDAFRECVEIIIKSQGKWKKILEDCLQF
ncbi:MAG TPA: HAD-IIIA family hydrolase, partial [bacterium]|nr:HAD-IIIA family hydrolase [bacterium]